MESVIGVGGHPLSGTRETWVVRFVAAFAIPHPPSAICHLPSAICHLPFFLPHSPFRIPHSAFSRERKGPATFWHTGNLVGPQRPHSAPVWSTRSSMGQAGLRAGFRHRQPSNVAASTTRNWVRFA